MSSGSGHTHRVSYHAVTRFVQRVLGTVLEIESTRKNALNCAQAHCAAAGTTVEAVQAIIYTPGIQLAASLGHETVTSGKFTVKISQPSGVITTVLAAPTRLHRRLSLLSERELHRKVKKLQRRFKRRPHGLLPTRPDFIPPVFEDKP